MKNEFLRLRNVQDPCNKCQGAGGRWYSSGATWRGGLGTASMTWDVCDECWGSGDKNRPWTDLRKMRDNEEEKIRIAAGNFLADKIGANFISVKQALEEVAIELEKLSRGRKQKAQWFYQTCELLAKSLREM